MAGVPVQTAQPLTDTGLDRRMVPRSEISLGVTLHRVDDTAVIPAAIANLSVTGFLAELPAGATVPDLLDVELPHAGRRKAQVMWRSGTMAGCTFTVPLARADISAARLKSSHVGSAAAEPPHLTAADPIWDVAGETGRDEKWPLPLRVALIATAAVIPWVPLVGLAVMLA